MQVTAADIAPLARIRTLLALDHTLDLLVATLLTKLGVPHDANSHLPTMLKELSGKKPVLKAHQGAIEALHKLRNQVHHHGATPSIEDIPLLVSQGTRFADEAVRAVLRMRLEQVTVLALITDSYARAHLAAADQAYKDGDCPLAAKESAIGLYAGWNELLLTQRGLFSWGQSASQRFLRALGQVLRNAADAKDEAVKRFATNVMSTLPASGAAVALENLLLPIDLARYGVDLRELARFQAVTPFVYRGPGGQLQADEGEELVVSKDDARFAIDFACNSVLRFQQWGH